MLPKHTGIKDHPINLVDDKQLSYALPSCPTALRNYPSASRTIALNCASEVSKTWLSRTGTRCLNWGSTRLVEVSIPTRESLLPRLPHHSPQYSEQAHQRTDHLAQPRLCLSTMGLMMVVVAVVIPIRCLLSRGFSRIAIPLTSIIKITGSSRLSAPKAFRAENDEVVGGGGRADKTVVDSFKLSKKSKSCQKVEKLQRPKKLQRPLVWRNQASWSPTLG